MSKLTFGFKRMESVLKMEGANLIIVAGETGGWKTSMTLSMAITAAEAGNRILFISTEYNSRDLENQIEQRFGDKEGRDNLLAVSLVTPDYEALNIALAEQEIDGVTCDAVFLDSMNTVMFKEQVGTKAAFTHNSLSLRAIAEARGIPVIASVTIPPKKTAPMDRLKDFGPVLPVADAAGTILLILEPPKEKDDALFLDSNLLDIFVVKNKFGLIGEGLGNPISNTQFVTESPYIVSRKEDF